MYNLLITISIYSLIIKNNKGISFNGSILKSKTGTKETLRKGQRFSQVWQHVKMILFTSCVLNLMNKDLKFIVHKFEGTEHIFSFKTYCFLFLCPFHTFLRVIVVIFFGITSLDERATFLIMC